MLVHALQILTQDSVNELLREPVDLTGIDSLQLYIREKGDNATRYVCEYSYDRFAGRASLKVLKLVYMGADGLTGNKWGSGGEKPQAHIFLSQSRNLNQHLASNTEGLVMRLENNTGLTILHMKVLHLFPIMSPYHTWLQCRVLLSHNFV